MNQQAAAPEGQQQTRGRAAYRKQQALGHQLPDDPRPAGADGHAHGELPLPRGGARQQQIGDVGASDQQNQPHDGHQGEQRGAILRPHLGESSGGRFQKKRIPQILVLHIGGEVARQGGAEDPGRDGAHTVAGLLNALARKHASQDAQPPLGPLVQRAVIGMEDRLAGDRDGDVETPIGIQPAEPRWGDAHDFENMTVQAHGLADGVRVAVEIALPELIADDGDGHGTAAVFVTAEDAPGDGRDTQHAEEIATDPEADRVVALAAIGQIEAIGRVSQRA